ncbi:MAG: rhomboid family intramembrane serine protease [Actinomycetota bacterium]|nr:rhomboid family intramembrane serine protease [Actinomycetota bacterium]
MIDASVGFQCPTCVAEGRKTTRSGRTAYGGLRPTDASLTSGVLIAMNVAVWFAVTVTGGSNSRLVELLALRPNGLCVVGEGGYLSRSECAGGGTWFPGVADGAYWQLVTVGFTHVSILHIGFNMFALWVIGPQLEVALGRARFLALYMLSLLAGSAVVMWAAPEFQGTVGASGAIYGLFAAVLVLALKVGGDVRQLLVLIGINVFLTFAIPNISWQGHLGGFIGGAAVAAALVHAPRRHRAAVQVSALVLTTVVIAVAVGVRSAALV